MKRGLLWTGAGVVLLLAVAEVGLRVGLGLGHPPLMQKDPDIGYLFVADQDLTRFGNHVAINSFHQRSPQVAETSSPEVPRIFVIGDSITFGGVQADQSETFTSLLASDLAAKGKTVEVLNASAGSWSIENEKAYLQRFGTFGADIVVLEIGSDDLLQRKSISDVVGVDPSYPDRDPPSALTELYVRYLEPRLFGAPPPMVSPPGTDAEKEVQFQRNMAALDDNIALAQAAGAKVILLHVPEQSEVEAGSQDRRYETFRPRFLDVAARRGVEVIDLSKEWRDRQDITTYYRDGTHPTVPGNHVIADRLFEAIAPNLDAWHQESVGRRAAASVTRS